MPTKGQLSSPSEDDVLRYIQSVTGELSTKNIAKAFATSESTARRRLRSLEKSGRITCTPRTHNGKDLGIEVTIH